MDIGVYQRGPALGDEQITSLGSAVGFASISAGATKADVQVEGGDVRYRVKGATPTATVGFLLSDGEIVRFAADPGESAPVFTEIKFISVSGSPVLNVIYY